MSTKTTATPKAKKPAPNPQKKMLLTAMKKTIVNNAVLPVLEDVLFTPGFATVTDLETFVTVPFQMPGVQKEGIAIPAKMFGEVMDMVESPSVIVSTDFSVRLVEGKREIKLTGDNPDNYPKNPNEDFKLIGHFGPEQMADLATALCFVSKDDLRPAMTGVFIHDHIAATDAHRLFWKPIEALTEEFIIPSKSVKIILAMGGNEWDIYHDGNFRTKWVNETGVEVVSRIIDARFPDYKVVIPDEKEIVAKIFTHPDMMLKELKNAGKFANRSTKQCLFTLNGKITLNSQDVDFGFEYSNVLDFSEFHFAKDYKQYILPATDQHDEQRGTIWKKKDGKTMFTPVGGTSKEVDPSLLMPTDPLLNVAFNGDFLTEILQKTPPDSAAEIHLWGQTKCAIINKHYLLMPLMLSQ